MTEAERRRHENVFGPPRDPDEPLGPVGELGVMEEIPDPGFGGESVLLNKEIREMAEALEGAPQAVPGTPAYRGYSPKPVLPKDSPVAALKLNVPYTPPEADVPPEDVVPDFEREGIYAKLGINPRITAPEPDTSPLPTIPRDRKVVTAADRRPREQIPPPAAEPQASISVPETSPGERAETDFREKFLKAQGESKRLRGKAGLADAIGRFASAFSGQKPSTFLGDMYRREAKGAEEAPGLDARIDALARAERARVDQGDPRSSFNRKAREVFAATVPALASRFQQMGVWETMTDADLKAAFKGQFVPGAKVDQGDRRVGVLEGNLERQIERDAFRKQLEINKANRDEEMKAHVMAIDWARLDAADAKRKADALAARMREERRREMFDLRQKDMNDRHMNLRVENLTRKLMGGEKGYAADAIQGFQVMEKIIPGILRGRPDPAKLKDFAGFVAKARVAVSKGQPLITVATTPEQRMLVLQAKDFMDVLTRQRTGAALNANEEKYYGEMVGILLRAPPEHFASAIQMFAAKARNRQEQWATNKQVLAALDAGFGPESIPISPSAPWWDRAGVGQLNFGENTPVSVAPEPEPSAVPEVAPGPPIVDNAPPAPEPDADPVRTRALASKPTAPLKNKNLQRVYIVDEDRWTVVQKGDPNVINNPNIQAY